MDSSTPTCDALLDLPRRQPRLIDELRGEVDRLERELDASRRAAKRQAAPFSERPGRKPGHEVDLRTIPTPEQVDRTIEAPLPEEGPRFGTPHMAVQEPYQIDRPASRAFVTRFRVPLAICPACRARVQDRHAEQTSNALGAAALQFGPRLLGLVADLKLPYRKAASLLRTPTGLVVTASALTRGGHRLRRHAQATHDRPIESALPTPASPG